MGELVPCREVVIIEAVEWVGGVTAFGMVSRLMCFLCILVFLSIF